jgi:hypothetical protein
MINRGLGFSKWGLGVIGFVLAQALGYTVPGIQIFEREGYKDREKRLREQFDIPDLSAERLEAATAKRERKNLARLGCWAESFGNNLIFDVVDRIPRPYSPVIKSGSRRFRPEPLKVLL